MQSTDQNSCRQVVPIHILRIGLLFARQSLPNFVMISSVHFFFAHLDLPSV